MASPLTAAINGKLRHAGAQIRTYRLRRRLTLARLGHAIGVTPSLLSMVERGVAMPSIGTLVAISEVLKVPMSSLFDSAGPPGRRRPGRATRTTAGLCHPTRGQAPARHPRPTARYRTGGKLLPDEDR